MFSAGNVVPNTHCTDDPPPTEETCEVACSADCLVGSWSSWSTCSHSCATKTAEGKQSRTRTVLAIPGKGNLKFSLITLIHFWLTVHELFLWCIFENLDPVYLDFILNFLGFFFFYPEEAAITAWHRSNESLTNY